MAGPATAPALDVSPDVKIRGLPTQIRKRIDAYAAKQGVSLNQAIIDHLDAATQMEFEPKRKVILRQVPKE